MARTRIGLLFGGKSGEHEVSLQSARGILEALDPVKYEVTLVGVDKEGQWLAGEPASFLLDAPDHEHLRMNTAADRVLPMLDVGRAFLVSTDGEGRRRPIDVFFPIIHGTYGEDGSLQGLLRLLDVPFVGASVLGSAVAMDKDLSKRVLRAQGIEVARHVAVGQSRKTSLTFEKAATYLGIPVFVKPANLGSSVGIAMVRDSAAFDSAVQDAFRYDRKIVIEEFVEGREIECAVLGNERPEASVCGEVRPRHDFYSYEAKYLDERGADLEIPADLDDATSLRIQEMAVEAFRALECEGMARVDFFLRPDGTPVLNEVNTLPGFTPISMYPKLWEASGLPYSDLLDRLIELAEDRHRGESLLERSFDGAAAESPEGILPEKILEP